MLSFESEPEGSSLRVDDLVADHERSVRLSGQEVEWRKREDSNLRCPCGHTCFRDRPNQPLWHASVIYFPNAFSQTSFDNTLTASPLDPRLRRGCNETVPL